MYSFNLTETKSYIIKDYTTIIQIIEYKLPHDIWVIE